MARTKKSTDDAPAQPAVGVEALPRSEQAYRYLRNAIRAGDFKPGDRLREADLATAIGLSRTPIREAFARLEANRLVINDPARGLVVTELDFSAVNELYFMREVLEGTAARLAAQHASEVELSILQDLCEQYREIATSESQAGLSLKNRQFHDMLCQCAHNRYLMDTVNTLHDSLSLLGNSVLTQHDRAHETLQEHEAVIEAICRRDPDAAEAAMRQHIRLAQKARMKQIFAQSHL